MSEIESIKIGVEFLEFFKNEDSIYEKLKLLEGKKYKDEDQFINDLEQLFPDRKETQKKIFEKLQVEDDDDTISQERLENGSIYPYDPSTYDIDIREEPQTIYELVIRKWDQGKLILDPEFQRNFVWKIEQQSQFIESVILNFPLPAFYINKNIKGKYIIVDGRQRLTTLRRFLQNKFRLGNLKVLTHLNGKNFVEITELDSMYQTKIEDKKLHIYLIQPSVPMAMVYDIFNRINTGGTQLQRQEIRSCIYLGKSTELLEELASQDYFKRAIDYGISPLRKKDQEAILRYLSFKIMDYETEYKNSLNNFVEEGMKKINSAMSDEKINELKEDFKRVMEKTFAFFGTKNFRVPTRSTRGRINLALLESVSYFFSNQSDDFLDKHKVQIKKNFKLLFDNPEYLDAIKVSTGDPQRVKKRFRLVGEILGNV